VNWYEAYAFCIWDGGFLPSETEWEFAAANGRQDREYPWGSQPPGYASQYAIYGCIYPDGGTQATCTGVANIAPVGTPALGAAAMGQLDMAGNVWQWNLDLESDYGYLPCADCANLHMGTNREMRGGPTFEALSPAFRFNRDPTSRSAVTVSGGGYDGSVGFRCARSP
jgi:formylglycine-generating enzyme required for sulfatase activity